MGIYDEYDKHELEYEEVQYKFLTKKNIIKLIVGSLMTIIVVVLLLFSMFTTVEDYTNLSIEEAEKLSAENDIILVQETQFSETVEKNVVISQSVAPGEVTRSGSMITIVVSSGIDTSVEVSMPDFTNKKIEEVNSWADENRMQNISIKYEKNKNFTDQSVIRWEIEGTANKITRETEIAFIVAKNDANVILESFLGKTKEEFISYTIENQLQYSITYKYHKDAEPGIILEQSIAAGEKVTDETVIEITVSKGKGFTVGYYIGQCSGYDSFNVVEIYSNSSQGCVIDQSESQGTMLSSSSNLTVTVSRGKIELVDYTSMPLSNLEIFVSEANKYGANLTLEVSYADSSGENIIQKQDVKNKLVSPGQKIKVTVGKGTTPKDV